jgi:hypothetical protein
MKPDGFIASPANAFAMPAKILARERRRKQFKWDSPFHYCNSGIAHPAGATGCRMP